jgi:hypothetical protein
MNKKTVKTLTVMLVVCVMLINFTGFAYANSITNYLSSKSNITDFDKYKKYLKSKRYYY